MVDDGTLPFGDATDDAVVAMLDGTLETFATGQGLTEAEARERLEAWPGLGARISTVVAARRGTRASRRSPKNLGLLIGGVIALAVIVTVAIIVIVRSGDSGTKNATPARAHIMDSYIGGLGEVGTDDALRTAIQRRSPVDQGLAQDTTATSPLNGSGLSIAAERCVRVNIPGRSVSLLATATWKAQPVVVYVADVTGAEVAFVSDLSSCAIVYSLRV
jgi:hypothetical protein